MTQVALGIDENTSLAYEGSSNLYGHAIWPIPFLSLATHIGPADEKAQTPPVVNLSNTPMLFREDYFDPVARVRRGRLYVRSASMNPADWKVQTHPAYSSRATNSAGRKDLIVNPDPQGYLTTRLVTFRSWGASEAFLAKRRNSVLILGTGNRLSAYSILDVELLFNGEELITVRTRASLGGLPDLNALLIPQTYRNVVLEQYEKAANAAFRDEPESVVDRCREAASAALIAKRVELDPSVSDPGKDLGDLAKYFEGTHQVMSNAGKILARLHSRGKSSERVDKNLPAISEGEAECALALLGQIYRELHWTM